MSNCQVFSVELQVSAIIMLQIRCYKIVEDSEIITFYSGSLFETNENFRILDFLQNAGFVVSAALP